MQIRKLAVFVAIPLIFAACKKNNQDVMTTQPVTPADTTLSNDVLKDSVLLLTRDIYLWNTQVPSTFNPESYADPKR